MKVSGGKTPTPVPTTAGSSAFGGMLYNGDFEVDDAGKPDGWSKFGGTMTLTSAAYDGTYSAELDSDTTSTKWLYQVVSVDGGEWYGLDGFAAVEGEGEAFIRISWYASDDGSGTSSRPIGQRRIRWRRLALDPDRAGPGTH